MLVDYRLSGKSKEFFKYSIINLAFNLAFAIVFVIYLKNGASGRMAGTFLAAFGSGIISLFKLKFKPTFDKVLMKEILNFSWPIIGSGILFYLFQGVDRALLEKIGDNYNLGLYNVAFQITSYLAIFGTVILQTLDPNLYKYSSSGNLKKALFIVLLITVGVSFINLIFIPLSEFLIGILTYNRYTESSKFANILVIRNIATTIAFSLSGILIGLGYPKIDLSIRIIGAIFAYFLYKYLISNYGYFGAAWGQSLSLFFIAILSLLAAVIINNIKIR